MERSFRYVQELGQPAFWQNDLCPQTIKLAALFDRVATRCGLLVEEDNPGGLFIHMGEA